MGEITFEVLVPFADEPPKRMNAVPTMTVSALFFCASQLFKAVTADAYDVLISLTDGTYAFPALGDTISSFALPESPSILLSPKEFKVTVAYEKFAPFEFTVSCRERVESILSRVCRLVGSIKPKHFVVCHESFVLINSLSIVEQKPGASNLRVVDASSDEVKMNFMELYLKGPVYLSLTDAVQLSAYLLQATKGPYRCFRGTNHQIVRLLPVRFQNSPGVLDDLRVQWSFLWDCTRDAATRKFTLNVQQLPLFNCTSFRGERLKADKKSFLPKVFELIFSDRRLLVLDFIQFKSRYSIAYRDVLAIDRDDDQIEFEYWDHGSVKSLRFETNTARSLFTKAVALIATETIANGLDLGTGTNTYKFRTEEEMTGGRHRIEYFPTNFIYDFINMDEVDESKGKAPLPYSELMHALAIRADSCAWHISVLLSKVTESTAKVLAGEITSYYARLMAYLTWLTYDHRPYDIAYDLEDLIPSLENHIHEARETIVKVRLIMQGVLRMFAPISKDRIYSSSKNVIGYVVSHLFSYIELPYASNDEKNPVFQEAVKTFLQNTVSMKDHIKNCLFSVGSLAVKAALQQTLDFVFRHHVGSLHLFTHVVETSPFREIDPSVILHQDSCNIMMTAIVEFSRLLWEDRQPLTDDRLQSFLAQAADLARALVAADPPRQMHLKTISEFLKIIDLNLSGLRSTTYHCFVAFREYASRLIGAFEIVPTLELPHMRLRFVQAVSTLVYAQPFVLKDCVPSVLRAVSDVTRLAYLKLLEDTALFDLGIEDGRDASAAALRIYIEGTLKPEGSEGPVPQTFETIFPVLALEHMVGRTVSEWSSTIANAYLWQIAFVHALAAHVIYLVRVDVSSGRLVPGAPAKKALGELSDFGEFSLWFPHTSSDRLEAARKLLAGDPKLAKDPTVADGLSLIKLALDAKPYLQLPKLTSPETIKIVNDAITLIFRFAFNDVSGLLRTNLPAAMAKFPQMFCAAELFSQIVYAIALRPAYVRALDLVVKMRPMLENIEYAALSYFSSGSISTMQLTKFQKCQKFIRIGASFSKWTDLTSLCPLVPLKVPPAINPTAKAIKRSDVSDLIADYRVAKNDLVECLVLHEKDNLEIVAERVGTAATRTLELLNLVIPENTVAPRIVTAFSSFTEALPKVFTYKLTPLHLRECLVPLDTVLDQAVEDIAASIYLPAEPARLRALLAQLRKGQWVPAARQALVTDFVTAITPLIKDAPQHLAQLLFDGLQALQDNELTDFEFLVLSFDEPLQPRFASILWNGYIAYVKGLEAAQRTTIYCDVFVWFREAVASIVTALKAENPQPKALEAVEALVEDLDSKTTIELISANVSRACSIFNNAGLTALRSKVQRIASVIPQLDAARDRLLTALAGFTDLHAAALIYNPAVRQIMLIFYAEFRLQDWDPRDFIELTERLAAPLEQQYASLVVSETLIATRRLMRRIRLTRPSAQPSFVTQVDKVLTRLEAQLGEYYKGKARERNSSMAKQRAVVDEFVQTFKRLPESNITQFVVRLIRNLSLDLATDRSFEPSGISRSITALFDDLSVSLDRTVQIRSLLTWLESVAPSVFPVDYDRLLGILRDLVARAAGPADEGLFSFEPTSLVDLAVQLSDALAGLNNLRHAVSLVKDVHKLFPVRAGFLKALTTVIRAFEAYAEEIQTFEGDGHPLRGVITTLPRMCTSLQNLVEEAFSGTVAKSDADAAAATVKEFVESCPPSIRETIDGIMGGPVRMLAETVSG
jgi:hypothetical protein